LQNVQSNTTQLIVIIRNNGIFYIITSGYMFRLYSSHLQAEVLFTYEGDI